MPSYQPDDFLHGADVLGEACAAGDTAAINSVVSRMVSDLSGFSHRCTYDLEQWLKCVGMGTTEYDPQRFAVLHSPVLIEHATRTAASSVRQSVNLEKGQRKSSKNAGRRRSLMRLTVDAWMDELVPMVPRDSSKYVMALWTLFWEHAADGDNRLISTVITDTDGHEWAVDLPTDRANDFAAMPFAAIDACNESVRISFLPLNHKADKREENVGLATLYRQFARSVKAR